MTPGGTAAYQPLQPAHTPPEAESSPVALVTSRRLAAQYDAVKDSRSFTETILHRWGPCDLFDDVALIASELVTNALRHGLRIPTPDDDAALPVPTRTLVPAQPGESSAFLRITLEHRANRLICAVQDPSSIGPVARTADRIAENGRGLRLVDCFADAWGWHTVAGPGKIVWALFHTAR